MSRFTFNPYRAGLFYFYLQAFEVVARYRDPQPQLLENDSCMFNLRPTICKS